jgi:hypothetical protein
MTRRHNGEGSIYPVKDGYRGYVWCTNSAGERYRKYVKGKSYEETQAAWFKLRARSWATTALPVFQVSAPKPGAVTATPPILCLVGVHHLVLVVEGYVLSSPRDCPVLRAVVCPKK